MENKEKQFLDVDDVSKICGVSKSKAYNIIRALNDNMISNGIPKEAIISGKISSKIFFKTYNL